MLLILFRLLFFLALVGVVAYFFFRGAKLIGSRPVSQKQTNPYAVLGISANATEKEIKDAYYRELGKYHPDKVEHLGTELQDLAKNKTREIVQAYALLTKNTGNR